MLVGEKVEGLANVGKEDDTAEDGAVARAPLASKRQAITRSWGSVLQFFRSWRMTLTARTSGHRTRFLVNTKL